MPKTQTASTVSGCLQRGKLRPGEEVWESLPRSRVLAPHVKTAFGDPERRQQKLQLLWTLYRTPPSALVTSPPGNMVLLLQAPGPQWGRVWLGSPGERCPTSALEITCSLDGGGPRKVGHSPSVTWPQCRGSSASQSVCEPPPSCRGLWPVHPYLSSRDQRGPFSMPV